MADDFKRITIRSLKDTATGAYSISDYDKDMRTLERALKSALPTDAFYHKAKEINYNDPTFKQIGKLKEDFYIKEGYTNVAQKALDQALAKLNFAGSSIDPYTGKETNPKYWATRTRPLSDDENKLIQELEKVAKEKSAEKETEATRFNRGTMLKILGAITGLADIVRRILSSVLNIATQQVKETTEAHNLGISREQMRTYGRLETAHSLKEGTISGALADIQNKFGNITSLDEKSLEALAVVMGGKIEEMATMGLGSSNPEAVLGAILDTFNERANAGMNSVGQYVGEQQARRELYSYLLKISPQIADIFATMQEEQHNINSLYRNQADTFAEWKNTIGRQRNTTQAGEGTLYTLGEEWGIFKTVLDEIKHALAVSIAPTLTRILRRLNNMRIGMSESEKLRLNAENRDANDKALKETEASIAFLEKKSGGNIYKLSSTEQAYYNTLTEYRDRLAKENAKDQIDNIVETANEIKVRQEQKIREPYTSTSYLVRSGKLEADIFENDSYYKKLLNLNDSSIKSVIDSQGTGKYGSSAFETFKKTHVKNEIERLRKTQKGVPESALRAQAEASALKAFAKQNYKFFYPLLLDLQGEKLVEQSYNDQTYDIDRLREKYGANLEGLKDILPEEALGTHKLYSVDVDENGVIVHKIVLDVNDSDGFDKGDKVLETWTGNDRGGATGSQSTITYDREKGITVNSYASGASNYKR